MNRDEPFFSRGMIARGIFLLIIGLTITNDRSLLVDYKQLIDQELIDHDQVEQVMQSRRNLKEITADQTESQQQQQQHPTQHQQVQKQQQLHCSPWNVDIDTWWQSHPDWEPDLDSENDTHTCFRPITNPSRAAFFREVYINQYHNPNHDCGDMLGRNINGVGYAAAMNYILDGFWSAFRRGYPFQVTKHRSTFKWIYNTLYDANASSDNQPSWATCPSQDHLCYFLPISNCPYTHGRPEDQPLHQYFRKELRENTTRLEENGWLYSYLTRPRQFVRRRLRDLLRSDQAAILPTTHQQHQDTTNNNNGASNGCTWMHVRRTDATSEQRHPRNFYYLRDYIEHGNIGKGETILLLTDDASTIEEAEVLHPEYNWVYWNRTRYRGPQKRNSHIPSNDPALELLIILGEIQLAGQCTKSIHGTSNMIRALFQSMVLQHDGLDNIEMIQIDTKLKETREKANDFMKQLEQKLKAARTTNNVANE